MLENTPKHRFGSNGGNWVCSCEKVHRKFNTTKLCARPRNTRFASFLIYKVAKCSKTLPSNVLGLMKVIGCVRAKKFIGSSVVQNSAFDPETHVSHLFSNIM